MDEKNAGVVTLTKEIALQDVTKGLEFQIDVDFKEKKNKNDCMLMDQEDFLMEDITDDSDTEEVLRSIEKSTGLSVLSSPEYTRFDELAAKMVDCVPSGEVKILIVEEGDGGLVPCDAEVTVHYAAYWERERIPFDSTMTINDGQPQTFRLGEDQHLLYGLEVGLSMVKGPTALFHLLVEPDFAWGHFGAKPRIRPERCLFTVSLIAVKDLAAMENFNQLPSKEQKSFEVTQNFVTASKEKAKDFFKEKLYIKSVNTYLKCMSVIQKSCPDSDEQIEEIKKMKSFLYLNLAVCYNRLNLPQKVLQMLGYLSRIIDADKNAKAMYHYAKAHTALCDYSTAEMYFKKALKLEPKNPDIGNAMAELDNLVRKEIKLEKGIWKNAFNNKNGERQVIEDDEFVSNIRVTCDDLCHRSKYTRFDLPQGLTNAEVACIKDVVKDFEGLSLVEDGEGRKRKITLVKTV